MRYCFHNYSTRKYLNIFLLFFLFLSIFTNVLGDTKKEDEEKVVKLANASSPDIDELRLEIENRNQEIKKIEDEIKELDKTIKKSEGESKTLKSELSRITNTISQLNKDVSLTQTKIKSAELNIRKIELEINFKENDISLSRENMAKIISMINEIGIESPVELILSGRTLSDGWKMSDALEQLQKSINEKVMMLEIKRNNLLKSHTELIKQKKELEFLKDKMEDQKNIANQNKNYTNKILKQTQNDENKYKQMLAEREKQKQALERELFDYESQLKVVIDPNSYPRPGARVLSWPVDKPLITQKFGKTPYSSKLYASGWHNGVDFGVRIGTPIKASAGGLVVASGDTDISCPNASYGKWVLIKHQNGLATLYAHLELIKTPAGEEVEAGQVIGYSGNSGYSTGPHLHFTVFVGSAVRVSGPKEYKSRVCGTYLRLPLAPTDAYLDPLAYLPASGSNIKLD